ncbi:RNA polymerase sigma factor [Rheinheimera sp. 4Y26]|uniref:RNA polymerase sigma factor n=1 Tax=Rheinheimera sp. 4Y26 TaxID=2977811 RepID=UPI0021B0D5FA|nr:sigma-70 family RNA polymerase sigma factor [Rheinheimera sp. 4Y26]MCT6699982.1 sigma-70 family RNA polymerase sigma factor [Rheinheimera sp. 4Y26]
MSVTIEQQLQPDVQAAMAGDLQAFSRLVQRCQNGISSIALAIVKDLDASEEVCQQVFIAAWQQLSSLQNPASFLPWLRQITRYRAYSFLREQKDGQTERGSDAEALLESFASDSNPAEELLRSEQAGLIRNLLDELPAESREIVLLFYREEQNSQQVASLLGLSEANVRKKLQRVRELLKEQLLARYGKLILTTAPGVGFSSLVLSGLLVGSPPAAAATASAMAAQSSGIAKFGWLFSGALLGALGGMLGVVLGMQAPLKNATSADERSRLIRYRNQALLWVGGCGLLLTAAYELTAGAVAPLLAFTLFIVGLGYLQYRVWQTVKPRLLAKAAASAEAKRQYRSQLFWCCFGILGGLSAGLGGMIVGLINSGRWFWG